METFPSSRLLFLLLPYLALALNSPIDGAAKHFLLVSTWSSSSSNSIVSGSINFPIYALMPEVRKEKSRI